MKFKFLWIAGLMLAAGILSPHAAHAGMTILSNNVGAQVYDNVGNNNAFDSYTGTSIPVNYLVNATAGDHYSRIQLNYAQSGNNATISNGISQKRDGGQNDYTQGYNAVMDFTVDANTTYNISGYYNVLDATSSGEVYFGFYLYDYTNSIYLFDNAQLSYNTLNENFVVGGAGGDSFNYSFGSLSGNLIAGNSYRFFYQAYIYALTADGGASATGNITLQLGSGAAAVPEPASIAMWGLGALGMAFARRKRKMQTLAV